MLPTTFHAIIVGGSCAGLSAAMALGRSTRNVLVIDSGNPCNAMTPKSHNFLTRDGATPSEIRSIASEQVSQYPSVHFVKDLAIEVENAADGFHVKTQGGLSYVGKKLLLASGVKDTMLPIPGFAECWGKSVIHCPYCHGYEVKGQKTALIANGDMAMHMAGMIKNLAPELTLLTNGKAEFTDEQRAKLEKNGIPVTETELAEVIHKDGMLSKVKFADGKEEVFSIVYIHPHFTHHSELHTQLGLKMSDEGFAKGLIQVDIMQKTSVPGVFAAGDCCTPLRSVACAVAAGNCVGTFINTELVEDSF